MQCLIRPMLFLLLSHITRLAGELDWTLGLCKL